MSDHLPPGIAVLPSFTAGEQPSPQKLEALAVQVDRAVNELEAAVGDLKGQSWPYTAFSTSRLALAWGRRRGSGSAISGVDERSLDIANLARLIGPASNINPRHLGVEETITEAIPVGVHEFSLRYPPTDAISSSEPVFSDTIVFANFKASKSNLQLAGDYHVSSNGKVFCASASAAGTVTYTYDPRKVAGGLSYTGSRFNVIPDPNQLSLGGDGLSFGAKDAQGRYPATVPTITHQQSNVEGNSSILDEDDPNYLTDCILPKVLVDNFAAGELIPHGFMYLKNWTTNEVYDDALVYFDSSTSVLIGNVELDNAIAGGDKFVLITVGTDITTSIDDLRIKSFHTHDRSMGEPFVSIDAISGFLEEESNTGLWVPSEIDGNFAPQYLHRDGWQEGVDENLNDQNSMRGHLVFGKFNSDEGEYVGSDGGQVGSTYGVFFGAGSDDTAAASIRSNSTNYLQYDSGSGSNGHHFQTKPMYTDEGIRDKKILESASGNALIPGATFLPHLESGIIDLTGFNPGSVFADGFFTTNISFASADWFTEGKDVWGWQLLVGGLNPISSNYWTKENTNTIVSPYPTTNDLGYTSYWLDSTGTLVMQFSGADIDMANPIKPYRLTIWYW